MTVSESTKKSLSNIGIKTENINVIHNGISNHVLTKLPVKEKVPTFIFMSRIVKMKGIEDVIKAFFDIQKQLRSAQLWIIGEGDGKYLEQLNKLIKLYSLSSKIRFFGRVDEKAKLELLKKAHILLHASVKEGWGLVVIEAGSQGTPAVVYDVDGLRDSVKNDKTGIVLEKNTPEEMSNQAIKLIKDKAEYEKLQDNVLVWAKSLTWEEATKQSLKLITNL
jgi:glycosyltransferase involved in cell wall biosynthesis